MTPKKLRLTIELIPEPCWYRNVRTGLPAARWDELRRETYARAGYRCEVCGGAGTTHPVDCHEEWHYDDARHVATLAGFVALCPACHEVKHLGRAHAVGRYGPALAHFAKVNGLWPAEAERLADAAFQEWEERSRHEWRIDLHLVEGRD